MTDDIAKLPPVPAPKPQANPGPWRWERNWLVDAQGIELCARAAEMMTRMSPSQVRRVCAVNYYAART